MTMKFGSKKTVCSLLLLVLVLLAAGCEQGTQPNSKSAASSSAVTTSSGEQAKPESTKQEEQKTLTVRVYYPNEEGTKLLPVTREVSLEKQDKYTAAISSLLLGTKEKGQANIFPKKTKLQSVKVENGIAKVSFNQDLQKNFVGGSTGEEMLVGSVVDTLTEFPEVKKVQILIEQKPVESLSGHMDLSEPVSRMENLL